MGFLSLSLVCGWVTVSVFYYQLFPECVCVPVNYIPCPIQETDDDN